MKHLKLTIACAFRVALIRGSALAGAQEIYAMTLVRAPEESAGYAQPVMINLLPPQRADVSGDFYLTARFREALNADKLALRVFAEGLDASGSVLPLSN